MGLKTVGLANGRLIGKVLIRLNVVRLTMLIFLETLEGEEEFDRAVNEKFLKKYYPSIWINT